jgi:SAM-dependent methyltransferase
MTVPGPDPFFTVYRERYAPGTVESLARVAAVLPFLRRHLPAPPCHVLDLCCGAGAFAFELERLGCVVHAIDRDPHLLALAQDHAARCGSAVTFAPGEARSFPIPEGGYEAVVLLGNPLPAFDPGHLSEVLQQVDRALRPGGLLIVDHVDRIGELLEAGPVATYDVSTGPPVVSVRGPYDAARGTVERLHLHLGNGAHARMAEHLWAPWLLAALCRAAGLVEHARETYAPHRHLSLMVKEESFLV